MGRVFDDVTKLKEKYMDAWWRTDSSFVALDKKYTLDAKRIKEKNLDTCINKMFAFLKDTTEGDKDRKDWQDKLKAELVKEAKANLDIDNKELESIVLDGFMDAAEKFVDEVQKFDSDFNMMDTMQAMRNVWIMNLIQVIADKEVVFTPSIFAYSMLYPYTDNYLDNPDITKKDKEEFNEHLKKKLMGEDIPHHNIHEEKIYKLISMIESQYDRALYPEVFDSIISIHNAQCKSLLQQSCVASPYENNILAISAEKGGTSVLADAYLVCGHLDDEFCELIFGFGFILQLIDDLQDVKSDIKDNSMTIFSQSVRGFKLDTLTNKLINFTLSALDFELQNKSPHMQDVKKLILDNLLVMILETVSRNKEFYSKAYLKEIEEYSPMSFRFFVKANKNMKKKMKNIKLDIAMFVCK
ncbi:MAG: hypothetical protein KAQ68_08375 [Clostridiales bacterium]|nr:hypothetical protein [Clostridiales bacterium]